MITPTCPLFNSILPLGSLSLKGKASETLIYTLDLPSVRKPQNVVEVIRHRLQQYSSQKSHLINNHEHQTPLERIHQSMSISSSGEELDLVSPLSSASTSQKDDLSNAFVHLTLASDKSSTPISSLVTKRKIRNEHFRKVRSASTSVIKHDTRTTETAPQHGTTVQIRPFKMVENSDNEMSQNETERLHWMISSLNQKLGEKDEEIKRLRSRLKESLKS